MIGLPATWSVVAGAQEQNRDQKDWERREAFDRGDEQAGEHHEEAENEDEFLALLVLVDPHRNREKTKHGEPDEGNHLGQKVR